MISRGPSTTFRRSRLALLAGAALAVALVCAPAAAASNTMVV